MKTTRSIQVILVIVILIVLFLKINKPRKKIVTKAPEKKYLVFEMTNVTNIETSVKKLIKILGPNDDNSKRMYGYAINCIPCLLALFQIFKRKFLY